MYRVFHVAPHDSCKALLAEVIDLFDDIFGYADIDPAKVLATCASIARNHAIDSAG